MTFTIDTDNNITAHDAPPAAQDNVVAFATEKEFTKATTEWPISRLVEVWNSFAGTSGFDNLKPVKKFTDRKAATTRIWAAIQNQPPRPHRPQSSHDSLPGFGSAQAPAVQRQEAPAPTEAWVEGWADGRPRAGDVQRLPE